MNLGAAAATEGSRPLTTGAKGVMLARLPSQCPNGPLPLGSAQAPGAHAAAPWALLHRRWLLVQRGKAKVEILPGEVRHFANA